MGSAETDFEIELLLYCDLWDEKGIKTSSIRRGMTEFGGAVETAAWEVMNNTDGLGLAVERLDCQVTIEALVVDERFALLFDDALVLRARERLSAAGC